MRKKLKNKSKNIELNIGVKKKRTNRKKSLCTQCVQRTQCIKPIEKNEPIRNKYIDNLFNFYNGYGYGSGSGSGSGFGTGTPNNKVILKIQKILKILIVLICLLLIISIAKIFYYNIQAHIINLKVSAEVQDVMKPFYHNLKHILFDIKKLNNSQLSSSQALNINQILKITANDINDNIIDKNNGIIMDGCYLGIYKYYHSKSQIKKYIYKKIPFDGFFNKNLNKFVENKLDTNNYSISIIKNIYNLFDFITINKKIL